MIFRGKDIDSVKVALDAIDLVREELVSYQAFPQYLSKKALAGVSAQ